MVGALMRMQITLKIYTDLMPVEVHVQFLTQNIIHQHLPIGDDGSINGRTRHVRLNLFILLACQ